MIKVFFFLLAIVASAFGQDMALITRAMKKINYTVTHHPEPLVSKWLVSMIDSGKVQFSVTNSLPEMSVSKEKIGGRDIVLLWYNASYVLNVSHVSSAEDKKDLLDLVLYHEAIHIEDHFGGRRPLSSLISNGPVSADDVWDKEWSAVSREWAMAKKIKKKYLVPVIFHFAGKVDSPRNFLEGFYQLQMTGNAVKMNPALAAGITARYKKELARVPFF